MKTLLLLLLVSCGKEPIVIQTEVASQLPVEISTELIDSSKEELLKHEAERTYYHDNTHQSQGKHIGHLIRFTKKLILQHGVVFKGKELIELDTNSTLVTAIIPCGFKSGYNEAIIIVATKQHLRYDSKTRKLNVLDDGSYITNDKKACVFKVDSGSISW